MNEEQLSHYSAMNINLKSILSILERRFVKIKGGIGVGNYYSIYFYDLMRNYFNQLNQLNDNEYFFAERNAHIIFVNYKTKDYLYIIKLQTNINMRITNIKLLEENFVDMSNGEVLFSKKIV